MPARGGVKEAVFYLSRYVRKDDNETLISSTSVTFSEKVVRLNDGYEFDDADGDSLAEADTTYTISAKMIDRIVEILPEEFTDSTLIEKDEAAQKYYGELKSEGQKKIFAALFNRYKLSGKFDDFIRLLDEQGIKYDLQQYSR
jgi:hypothetical protein